MSGVARAARRGLPGLALVGALSFGTVGAAGLAAGPASAAQGCTPTSTLSISIFSGSDQVAKVGTAYAEPLEAEVLDSCGSPITVSEDVTFTLPASGASGTFPGGLIQIEVGTANNGIAAAPTLTANEVSGSFTVEASIAAGSSSVDFDLTNTTVGAISSVAAVSGNNQSTAVGDSFGQPLEVAVTDTYGDPIVGASVAFTVVTTAGAGATFSGGGASAEVQTNASGVASTPTLTAGDTAGAFSVIATVSGAAETATFALTDLAGPPTTVTAGVGSSQSAELGTDFAVPLAVTVTDDDGNPAVGDTVTFKAPASGPSGVFAGSAATVEVPVDSSGVATAPDFSANDRTGGYVVTATVSGVAAPATFAMVNEPRTTASAPGPVGTYWLVTSTGKVMSSGGAARYGSPAAKKLVGVVVGMAADPSGAGYWIVTSKGAVYGFGAAATYRSAGGAHLLAPVVGIAATADGDGYWLVTSKGAVHAYGDAAFHGSVAKSDLVAPVVGIAATADGKGYWLAAANGAVYAFGDATFHGSVKSHLAAPVVGIAATADGKGYWLAAANGVVYAYGDATNFGAGLHLSPAPVRAIVAAPGGTGYWVVSADGTVAGFGAAGAQGSPTVRAKTVVGGAA
jgi:hypothetical protein